MELSGANSAFSTKLLKAIACVLVAIGIANFARLIFWLSDGGAFLVTVVSFLLVFSLALAARKPVQRSYLLYSMLPLLLLGFWSYFLGEFGAFDWSSIIYHATADLGDSGQVDVYMYKAYFALFAVICMSAGLLILKNLVSWVSNFDKLLAVLVLVLNPAVSSAAVLAFYSSTDVKDERLAELYEVPRPVRKPASAQPNFIHIFLESTERAYLNEPVFGPIMQPLAFAAHQGFSATNLLQVKDTGWSAAGSTSAYCGVPLSSIGLGMGNHFTVFEKFMPSAKCLGDILKQDGYDLTLISGADKESAAFDKIFGQHGFDSFMDFNAHLALYPEDAKSILKDGRTTFGSHDDIVFRTAFETLEAKKVEPNPFGMTIMTMGGHAPHGNLSPSCKNRPEMKLAKTSSLKAIYCTNLLVQEFLIKAQNQGLLENTIVVLQSDHLAMKNEVFHDIVKSERRNLFYMFGPGIKPHQRDRVSTTMDIFPTLLEALGYDLPNGKAGLGTSMFSDNPSIAQKLGVETIDDMISRDSKLRFELWHPDSEWVAQSR